MSNFTNGSTVLITFGAYKGQKGVILRWSGESNLYIIAVRNATDHQIEIALRKTEMELL